MDIFLIIWTILMGLACLIMVITELDFFGWTQDKFRAWRERRRNAKLRREACYAVVVEKNRKFYSFKLFRYEIDAIKKAAFINSTYTNQNLRATAYYWDNENLCLMAELGPSRYPFEFAFERRNTFKKEE